MDKIKIIDAHTHVQFPQFDKDREEVIERAISNGIGMISAGADLESTEKGIELASKNAFIWTTAGIHPHEADTTTEGDLKKLEQLAENEKVVGIGECGLDYFRISDNKDKDRQKDLFLKQIEISKKLKKPLVIHSRDAFDDLIDILKTEKGNYVPGICHFYTGDEYTAKKLADLGFGFTFGGLITKTCEFDDVIQSTPKDLILVETDAPFVAPLSRTGQRNEPLFITEVIKSLAVLWDKSEEEVSEITKRNTIRIFSLK